MTEEIKQVERLKKRYANGGITRRRFMEGALALGMTVASASAFVSSVAAATPKRGGVYRVGLPAANTGDNLDTATNSDAFMINMAQGAVRNCVTEVNAYSKAVPELAESLEPSADAATWVVKVRKGVVF
ncbi:MAG: peptide ABC transporter substrate-binding protein, partial [Rhodospirillales bacterium]